MTRGIFLNNPACIRLSNLNRWKGLSKVQRDKEFCTFTDISYGIRALLIILRTYFYKHCLTSVREIISRYAPSSENNTDSYISYVSKNVNSPDNLELFDPWKRPTLQCYQLCKAICEFESGYVLNLTVFVKCVSLL